MLSGLATAAGDLQEANFHIPRQRADTALTQFAEQAGLTLIVPFEKVRDRMANRLVGTYPLDEAIEILLRGTGLAARFGNSIVLTIAAAEPGDANGGEMNMKAKTGSVTAVASMIVAAGASAQELPVADTATEPGLEEIVVTGSRIARSDYKTVQPLTIISAEDVRTGAVGTPLELMARLPSLGSLSAYENQDGGRTRGSASSINMRGLGGQNTLILLNGRRVPYYSLPLGSLVFYNINNLPLAAVERVEVLRDGASAVYGADATAGVVNFITRRDVSDRHLALRFGNTFDGAAPEYRATLSYGKAFNGGRSQLYGVADVFSRDPLMAVDRDFATIGDKRGMVAEPFGSAPEWNHLTDLGPFASFSLQSQPGLPDELPGMTADSAHVDFDGELVPGDRDPGDYYNDAEFFSVAPGRESRDVFLSFSHELGEGLELFTELSYNDVESRVYQSPMSIASTQNRDANDQVMVIPAENYYNPFGSRFFGPGTANPDIAPRAVQFVFLEEAFGPRIGDIETSQDRELIGLRGQVNDDWQWEIGALRAANSARDTTRNMISRSALVTALARDTPDAFNMFAGPGANASSVLDPIRTASYIGGDSRLMLIDARLSGGIWELPAGDLNFAFGTEYREERLESDYSPNYLADDLLNVAAQDNFTAERNIRSAFLELQIPLLDADHRPWLSQAELQLAARTESFNDFGTTTKPRIGFAATVLPSLFMRGSVGRGFRAPTLTQLYGSEGRSMAARVDPFRPQDGRIRRQMRQPAVPTLQPEKTESRTIGLIMEPPLVPGLSVGVDWWSYEITDQIAVIARDTQLALEAAGGPYSNPNIVRLAPTPAEPIGPIIAIIEPWRNFARVETDGYDFTVSYTVEAAAIGRLKLGVDATYIREYERQLDPAEPPESFPNDQSRPQFRATWSAELERESWNVRTLYRYTSDYEPFDAIEVDGESYRIPSYGTWDLMLTYELSTRDVRFTLGINDILDRDPPLYPVRQGYDARMASPQGRFGYLNLSFGL